MKPTTLVSRISTIACFKKTEHGEDEVYIIYSGWISDGSQFSGLIPGKSGGDKGEGHWNFNNGDDDANRERKNIDLVTRSIPAGERFKIEFRFVERDGGSYDTAIKVGAAGAVILAGGTPQAVAAAQELVGVFLGLIGGAGDSDDYLGSIILIGKAGEKGRFAELEWKAGDRCERRGLGAINDQEMVLTGDGSEYKVWLLANEA